MKEYRIIGVNNFGMFDEVFLDKNIAEDFYTKMAWNAAYIKIEIVDRGQFEIDDNASSPISDGKTFAIAANLYHEIQNI